MNKNTLSSSLIYSIALLIGVGPLGWAAAPPSSKTRVESAWTKLSQAADQDLTSPETQKALDDFLKVQNNHPHAARVHYLYGERLFRLGQYEKAAVAFEKFLGLHPKHNLEDSALYRLGESYYNARAYNSAQAAWERLVKNHPASALTPEALRQIGLLNMRASEWGRADESFQKLKSGYPVYRKDPETLESHGIIKYNLGDYPESAAELERVNLTKAAYYRGLALFSLKLFDETAAVLASVSNDATSAYKESALFLKAESSFQKKDYNLAANGFAGFVASFPTSPLAGAALLRQAACAFIVGENDKAVKLADAAAQKKSGYDSDVHAAFIKGSALLTMGQFEPAVRQFSMVAERADLAKLAAPALVRRAWCYKRLGNGAAFEADIKSVEQRFPLYPDLQLARFLAGVYRYEQKKFEDAAERFESSLIGFRYGTLSDAGLALMAISLDQAGRADRTVTAANSALKLIEKNFTSQSLYWRAQSYFFIGKAFYDMRRFREAIPYFERVTTQFSDHPLAVEAQFLNGWALAETGENEKARQKAQVLLDNDKLPKTLLANASFLRASTYFNAKDYDKALVSFSDHLKQFPKSPMEPRIRYLSGLSFHQKKVFGSAIEEWTALIKDFPTDPLAQDAHLLISDLYFKSGDFAKSATTFKAFREQWPKSPHAPTAMWQELQAYFNAKDDETAIRVYPLFIETYKGHENVAAAEKQLEMIYYRRGAAGNPDKLEEFLKRYPKSPFAPAARFKLGDMAIEQKAWNRAIQDMEQFVRDYPSDKLVIEAQYGLAIAYENSDQADKAVIQYRTIMNQFANKPGAVDAAFRLGSLHFKKDRFAEALEAFKFASTRKMSDDLKSNVMYNIALCAESLGHYEEAALAYAKFAALAKTPEQKRESLMNAGLLMKKAEQPAKAAPYFTAVLKDPGSQEIELQAINLLGDAYKASGKNPDAVKTYEKLVTVEPASSDLRLAGLAQLAYLYEQKKDLKRAIEIYEKIAISDGKAEWVNAARQRMDVLVQNLNPLP